jgi:hypothetical protein
VTRPEDFLKPACGVATLRPERGYLVAIYDESTAQPTKPLRRQFRGKYDDKKVRNTDIPMVLIKLSPPSEPDVRACGIGHRLEAAARIILKCRQVPQRVRRGDAPSGSVLAIRRARVEREVCDGIVDAMVGLGSSLRAAPS